MTITTLVLVCGILAVCGTIVCLGTFAYKLASKKLDVEERCRAAANATAEKIFDKAEKVIDKVIDKTLPSNNNWE